MAGCKWSSGFEVLTVAHRGENVTKSWHGGDSGKWAKIDLRLILEQKEVVWKAVN